MWVLAQDYNYFLQSPGPYLMPQSERYGVGDFWMGFKLEMVMGVVVGLERGDWGMVRGGGRGGG